MMDQMTLILESFIKLSMVIMIGIYFIFSNTVMPSLKLHESGSKVMIDINRIILNPMFMAIFLISGLGSLYFVLSEEGLLRISGIIFFVGTTVVTIIKNVPLNDQLRDAESERDQVWQNLFKRMGVLESCQIAFCDSIGNAVDALGMGTK